MFLKLKFLRFFQYVNMYIQIIFGILICTILFWSCNKGFDLCDESFYLIFSRNEVDNFSSIVRYDLVFKLIYKIFGIDFGIIGLRYLRFILISIVLIFTFIVLRKRRFLKEDKFILFFSAFAGYSMMPQSLSYYTLTFLVVLIYGLILYRALKVKESTLYISIGIVSAFGCLIKPPMGLLL